MNPSSEDNTMDDLQFRRILYAEPNCKDADVLTAKAQDPAKQQFAQEVERLEQKIATVVNVPVPDELASKLILKQVMLSHQQQKRKNRLQLAMAASVAFALGLTFNLMQASSAYTSIGDYALAHAHHEQVFFNNDQPANISLASLNEKMLPFQGQFTSDIGPLISVSRCDFGNINALHLTYQGKYQPVTILVIPSNTKLPMHSKFTDQTLHGIASTFEHAEVIIVADKAEPLEHWQQNLANNIKWSI
jgi:hypothetical protein